MDLSLRHVEGRRVLDHVKTGLIDYIRATFDDDDAFYLYHPDIIETMHKIGEHVGAVSNFETDGWKFHLNYALEQTLYVVDAEGDFEKMLVLFTDRFNSTPLVRLAKIKERHEIDCEVYVFCIGEGDPHIMSLNEINFVSVKDVKNLSSDLKENLKYGHSQQLKESYGHNTTIDAEADESDQ